MDGKDIELFTIHLSVNEIKEIASVLGDRNRELQKEVEKVYNGDSTITEERLEEIGKEVINIGTALHKITEEIERVYGLIKGVL
jgi:hypothetical protein